jgi:hypothetical protein
MIAAVGQATMILGFCDDDDDDNHLAWNKRMVMTMSIMEYSDDDNLLLLTVNAVLISFKINL